LIPAIPPLDDPATVFFVPGLILTLGAGFAFNDLPPIPILWATVSISIGSTIGACCAFLLGRSLVRSWIQNKIADFPKFAAVDKAIITEGWKIVFLIRLSPVLPFNVMNYALALTGVNFWHYALASWIGMLPGTLLYVYIGASLSSISQIITGNYNGGIKTKIFFFVGLGMAIVLVVIVSIIAKRAINKSLAEAQQQLDKEKEKEKEPLLPSTFDDSTNPTNSPTVPLLSPPAMETNAINNDDLPPAYTETVNETVTISYNNPPPSYYESNYQQNK